MIKHKIFKYSSKALPKIYLRTAYCCLASVHILSIGYVHKYVFISQILKQLKLISDCSIKDMVIV